RKLGLASETDVSAPGRNHPDGVEYTAEFGSLVEARAPDAADGDAGVGLGRRVRLGLVPATAIAGARIYLQVAGRESAAKALIMPRTHHIVRVEVMVEDRHARSTVVHASLSDRDRSIDRARSFRLDLVVYPRVSLLQSVTQAGAWGPAEKLLDACVIA